MVPDCILEVIPYALPGENVTFSCCVGGSGTPVVPSTICHPFFGRSPGSSRDRTNLGCSYLCVCRRGLGHSRPVFYHYTGHRVPVGIGHLFGTVPRLVVRFGAQCVGLVLRADLTNYTHTGPLCMIVSGIAYKCILIVHSNVECQARCALHCLTESEILVFQKGSLEGSH